MVCKSIQVASIVFMPFGCFKLVVLWKGPGDLCQAPIEEEMLRGEGHSCRILGRKKRARCFIDCKFCNEL